MLYSVQINFSPKTINLAVFTSTNPEKPMLLGLATRQMLTHKRTSRQQHGASLGNQLTCHTLLPTSTHSITHPNTIRTEINKTPSSISEKNRETAERRFVVMVGETRGGKTERLVGVAVVVAVCSQWDEMWGLQRRSRKNKCRSWLRNSSHPPSTVCQ
jgi:hypothetical protein